MLFPKSKDFSRMLEGASFPEQWPVRLGKEICHVLGLHRVSRQATLLKALQNSPLKQSFSNPPFSLSQAAALC